MFMFDIETLGVESNSVILSFSCIYFDPSKKDVTYEELLASAFFAKLDAKDQLSRLKRTASEDTLKWWGSMGSEIKAVSFTPKDSDLKAEDAMAKFKEWTEQFPNHDKCIVWARGNLDQVVFCSLETTCGLDNILPFWRWRDVRTAVDLMTGSSNGYATVENFDPVIVHKHNPIHDCAYDVLMMLRGVPNETSI